MAKTRRELAHALELPPDRSLFDIIPGYWMWRQDPSVQAMMHNHEILPLLAYCTGVTVVLVGAWKFLGRINRPESRPLFVINKKTWFNTKVPRRRARDYATRFMTPPKD